MKTSQRAKSYRPARLMWAGLLLATAGALATSSFAAPPDGMGRGYGPGYGPGMHGGGQGAMMGGGGPGMGLPMMGGGRHMERMLDQVNATAEQRTQIRQIMQAAQTDVQAQRSAGRALHEQARQLWTQPTVDARAAEVLRQQMLAQHDQVSKRMMQAMLDASRVLTPEQRKTLADRMAQRRALMQRHWAEREALDKAQK